MVPLLIGPKLNTMVSPGFASRIACRSEPTRLSFVFVTVSVPALAADRAQRSKASTAARAAAGIGFIILSFMCGGVAIVRCKTPSNRYSGFFAQLLHVFVKNLYAPQRCD